MTSSQMCVVTSLPVFVLFANGETLQVLLIMTDIKCFCMLQIITVTDRLEASKGKGITTVIFYLVCCVSAA